MTKDENSLNEMGKRIVEKRKQLNWSQEKLAEEAGITVQMLSTAERGAKGMRPTNLLKISNALNVSADYILKGTKIDVDDFKLFEKIKDLSHDQRVALENIIENFVSVCKKN